MPITLSCPSCGGGLSVPDEQAGQTVQCPSCQTVITVPVPIPPPVPVTAMAVPPPPPPVGGMYGAGPGIVYVAPMQDPTSLWGHFINCLKQYATFTGRARRREFWGFCLFWFLTSLVLGILNLVLTFVASAAVIGLALSWLFTLVFLLPSFAVICRRFHDIGKSGVAAVPLYIAIPVHIMAGAISGVLSLSFLQNARASSFAMQPHDFTPMMIANGLSALSSLLSLGALIYILIFLTRDSVPGDNPYGPNPKGVLPYQYGTEVRSI